MSFSEQPKNPPKSLGGILLSIGPGLIIAGQIVGSGELIATTKTGADAGFWLLWLIVIGCLIKVFTQIEFGRYSLTTGKTTLQALNEIPGPRLRVNWIIWYWAIMFLASTAQQGGIVGGVGQALAMTKPLTAEGRAFNHYQDTVTQRDVVTSLLNRARQEKNQAPEGMGVVRLQQQLDSLNQQVESIGAPPESNDDILWAILIAVMTSVALIIGRYNTMQTLSTILVGTFTCITVWNLYALQNLEAWRVSFTDLRNGLSFGLPPVDVSGGRAPIATALATFGIIGVGATELVSYPYWCIEKGYAAWTGPREKTLAWSRRARGWLRVLKWDAWLSSVIYTLATVIFYLLGAAVLGRTGLSHEGNQMIRTLAEMYVPVFGPTAQIIFLFGAIAVLYSTFFLATAGNARVAADSLRVIGLIADDERTIRFWTTVFCGGFPIVSLLVYIFFRAPVALVLLSGLTQAIMLPMLAGAALFFRYRRCDEALKPGKIWDALLWASSLGLLVAGSWAVLSHLGPVFSN